MEAFRFAHPHYLYLLGLVPVLVLFFIYIRYRRIKSIKAFGNPEVIESLMPDVSSSRPVWKFVLISISIVAFVFLLAGPQFGSKLQKVKRKGVELMIVLDVSNSMMAQDIKPNRLERSKQAISRLVEKLVNDKIGLIVFAGDAYIQLPITTDYASAKMFLSTINTNIVPVQGTAIGKAIDLAVKSFGPESEASRAIIVITDGENHEDDAIAAAKRAQEKGIVVHTIGMGLPQGAPIPIEGSNSFIKDRDGKIVITKLDADMLAKISAAGGGDYFTADNRRTHLSEVFDKISKMEKTEFDAKVYSDYEDQFQWLAWIILGLLVVEIFILDKKNKIFSKIKIFDAPQKENKQ